MSAESAARFDVVDTFDLSFRPGLLVTGRLTGGEIKAGTELRAGDGAPVRVIGVEFLSPANQADGTITILVERENAAGVQAGSTLGSS